MNLFKNTDRNKIVYQKNREKVAWKIPTLFNNDAIAFALYDHCKDLKLRKPYHSAYGTVRCGWSGGRPSKWLDINENKAREIIEEYNKREIHCCFTFSNYHINKDSMDDEIGNLLLEIASKSNYTNYAIVSSDILADYIRTKYPNVKLIASLLKPVYEKPKYDETPEYYNKLSEVYDKVVVRPDFYKDNDFMKKLKRREKIELLVNQACLNKCPLAPKHYSRYREIDDGINPEIPDFCNINQNHPESVFNSTSVSNKELDELIKMGFINFKLKGRNLDHKALLGMFGGYMFDSTGPYQNMKQYLYHIFHKYEHFDINQ